MTREGKYIPAALFMKHNKKCYLGGKSGRRRKYAAANFELLERSFRYVNAKWS